MGVDTFPPVEHELPPQSVAGHEADLGTVHGKLLAGPDQRDSMLLLDRDAGVHPHTQLLGGEGVVSLTR